MKIAPRQRKPNNFVTWASSCCKKKTFLQFILNMQQSPKPKLFVHLLSKRPNRWERTDMRETVRIITRFIDTTRTGRGESMQRAHTYAHVSHVSLVSLVSQLQPLPKGVHVNQAILIYDLSFRAGRDKRSNSKLINMTPEEWKFLSSFPA